DLPEPRLKMPARKQGGRESLPWQASSGLMNNGRSAWLPPWLMPDRDAAPAFGDGVAQRLFDVDILARLASPDGHQRVPMIGCGDGDGVERLANVLNARRRSAPLLLDGLAAGLEQARIGVDQVGDLHALEAEVLVDVAHALAVDAGHPNAAGVVRPQHPARGLGAGDGDERKCATALGSCVS